TRNPSAAPAGGAITAPARARPGAQTWGTLKATPRLVVVKGFLAEEKGTRGAWAVRGRTRWRVHRRRTRGRAPWARPRDPGGGGGPPRRGRPPSAAGPRSR